VNKIIDHMRADPNSTIHALIGAVGGISSASLCWLVYTNITLLIFICCVFIGSLITGLLIEIDQRFTRMNNGYTKKKFFGLVGRHQNTVIESILDVFQTGLFPLTIIVLIGNKNGNF